MNMSSLLGIPQTAEWFHRRDGGASQNVPPTAPLAAGHVLIPGSGVSFSVVARYEDIELVRVAGDCGNGCSAFSPSHCRMRHQPRHWLLATSCSQAAVYTPPSVLTRKISSLLGPRETAEIVPPDGMAPVRMFHQPRH